MKHSIGIDVGGTKILIGAVDESGGVSKKKRYAMDRSTRDSSVESVLNAAADFTEEFLSEGGTFDFIGVGLVGYINPYENIWVHSISIPIDKPVALGAILEERYGVRVQIDNDVQCATMAELRLGAGKTCQDFYYINVGTGIACGMVFGGRRVKNGSNYLGEICHMTVTDHGEPCGCGQRGCLEPIASGGGLIESAKRRLCDYPASLLNVHEKEGRLHAGTIFEAAEKGDELALFLRERAVEGLSTAVSGLCYLLMPERIIFGGSVGTQEYLVRRIEKNVMERTGRNGKLHIKGFGISEVDAQDVGMLGAASLRYASN